MSVMNNYDTPNILLTKKYRENEDNWLTEPVKDGLYYKITYKPIKIKDIKSHLELKVPIVHALTTLHTIIMEPENELQEEYVRYLKLIGHNIYTP